jgi:hypothetical protein
MNFVVHDVQEFIYVLHPFQTMRYNPLPAINVDEPGTRLVGSSAKGCFLEFFHKQTGYFVRLFVELVVETEI